MEACLVRDFCDGKVSLEFSVLVAHKKCSATNLGSLTVGGVLIDEFDRASQIITEILGDEPLSSSARTEYTL